MSARQYFKKIVYIIVLSCILGVAHPTPIFSTVAPTFSNLPSSINSSDEVEVDVNYFGDPKYYADKTYYLRGVFYQTSGKYCSFTQNNSGNWINTASDPTQLYQIQTNLEGSWSGKLKVKVDVDNNFKGSGAYQFKVGRYTASGSVSWSTEQTLNIQAPSIPTPTPTPSTSQSSSSNTSSQTTSTIVTDDSSPETEPVIGVVAGASLGIKSSPSTLSADFEISDIISATPSSDSAVEATPASDTTSTTSSKFTPIAIAAGGFLTLAAIAPFILKKYNKNLWEKILKFMHGVGGRSSSGRD